LTTRVSAATTVGSNCVPALLSSSSIAASMGMALRYTRSVVIAL